MSLAASSFLLLDAASSLVFQVLTSHGSSLSRSQYFSFFENLGVQFLASTREDFFNVLPCACTSLEALVNTLTLCKLNCSIEGDFSLIFQLTLVADQVDSHILRSMLLNFLQPTSQIVECLIACDIVRQEYAVRSAIENSCYRFE